MIDKWLDSLTPRIVRRWAVRTLIVAGPVAVAAFFIHALGFRPFNGDGTLQMIYSGGMFVGCTAFVVAAFATCHMKIAAAFGHGYRMAQMHERDFAEERPKLHVVD